MITFAVSFPDFLRCCELAINIRGCDVVFLNTYLKILLLSIYYSFRFLGRIDRLCYCNSRLRCFWKCCSGVLVGGKDRTVVLKPSSRRRIIWGIQELKTLASCLPFSFPVLEFLVVSITYSTCLKILFFIFVSILGFLLVE